MLRSFRFGGVFGGLSGLSVRSLSKFVYVRLSGERVNVRGREEETLKDLLEEEDISIGACGGDLVCGRCQVYVDEAWKGKLPKPTEEEDETLETVYKGKDTSRLACAITWKDAYDGLVVYEAPQKPKKKA
uniref:Electron transport ferredoxin n=1 Tax=Stygiella incarcerata TaxID=1712417 RepID=A0A192ZI40_9EUKA|nr:electron transport ferredoxin [Stygiella incarcerata]|eukprot:TRINITY_DN1751_c0_g1_i1.p2 TRINITY_DN1751_c0_g1~~TRINITY_DN1751_c0_g1_i1.p2  ORF type:complete len:130 (-),score=39.75 TRINITY_DN1751_c0_g1_i1:318-707(-)